MKLTRSQTRAWIKSADHYQAICAAWKRIASDKEARQSLTGAHHLLYAVLRGKDFREGLAPITNRAKLENGGQYDWGLARALKRLRTTYMAWQQELLAPFVDAQGTPLLTAADLAWIRQIVPADAFTAYESGYSAAGLAQLPPAAEEASHA